MTYCDEAWATMEQAYQDGKQPKKFPIQCRRCWKVLLFDVPSWGIALEVMGRHPEFLSKSQPMNYNPDAFIVVFYTHMATRRDFLMRSLKSEGIGRTEYRFACREFQDKFPSMFLSTKQADRRCL